MKILLCAASFPPPPIGGSIEYLYNIISNLPEHNVVILTADADPETAQRFDAQFPQQIVRSDLLHHPMEAHKRSPFRRMFAYVAWPFLGMWRIMRDRPDVIQIGEANTAGLSALLASKLFNIPYIHYVYAEEIPLLSKSRLRNSLFMAALHGAEVIVTVSDYSRQLLIDCGIDPKRIVKVVPSVGHEKNQQVSAGKIERIIEKYSLKGHQILLTVGALKKRKNQLSVVEAMPKIIQNHPNTKYVVVGGGDEELKRLEQRVRELNIEEYVLFTGRVDNEDLVCFYKICDVFVMPHRQVPETLDTEGCPTVFLEASMHGKPVVGGNAGGVSDAILDQKTGFIIEGTDPKAIADAVSRLFSDPDLRAQMGQAGRNYASTLSPKNNGQRVWELSQKVAKSS